MGGGSQSHSSDDEDDTWGPFRHGKRSPLSTLVPGLEMGDFDLKSSSREDILPAAGVPASATGSPTFSTYGSRGAGTSWSAESKIRRNHVDAFEDGDLEIFHGRQNREISDTEALRGFGTRLEEAAEDTQMSGNVSPDLRQSTPASKRTTGALPPVHKTIFKLMQIENDSQDLSFVEKVILSRDELFSLCNNIAAGSAKASEGRRIIDFESLNVKSMKVVGLFGSKDVMKEIFLKMNFTEQGDVWMQMNNDTLAPGIYAWLHGHSVFVFYWHQGHSLPKATRKDMSCNFIRYIFDLCDTIFVCLESNNLENCLIESAPKFSKRQRNQRLQVSLVKASEDSIKVTAGFLLQNLPLGYDNRAHPYTSGPREKASLSFFSGNEYKLSEGHSRIALLASYARPRKLSSVKDHKDMKVKEFPAFIHKWTVDNDYSLDLTELSDTDFVVFMRCANLREADAYERLVEINEMKLKTESEKTFDVDQLVDKKQELLSCCLESFISTFLESRYSWEENLTLLNTSVHHPVPPEDLFASKGDQNGQSGEMTSPVGSSVNPSGVSDSVKSQAHFPHAEDILDVNQDRLNQHERDIYNLLFGKDSIQRLVFPHSKVYMYESASGRYNSKGDERRIFTIASAGREENVSSKFAPILYGTKITFSCTNDSLMAPKTGTFRLASSDVEGPMLTDEAVFFKTNRGEGKKIILEPVQRTGDLRAWLDQQVVQMEFPHLWKRAALLTAISEKLSVLEGHQNNLTEDICRRILISHCPLEEIERVLTAQVLDLARNKWEELPDLRTGKYAGEKHQVAISELVGNLCVDLYKGFREAFQSMIAIQSKRYSAQLLSRRIRKQISEDYKRLEAKLNKEEKALLAFRKDYLSRKETGSSLKLTIEACHLNGKSGGWGITRIFKWNQSNEDNSKISIRFVRQEFEKESITWHGFELAPMKEDLDQLATDDEYAFSPSCSEGKDVVDLDPTSQKLLRVVFLKAGQLLAFIVEGQGDSAELVVYLCPKFGVKLYANNCIRRIRRGFDLIAFDERSRFIALYDFSLSVIKTYRFDETFRHMDWTGVDINLCEYSIGRLIWMDFVTDKSEIVFIDDLNRARLCEVSQPGMVRSGNVHLGQSPIIKACVTSQGSCLLVLRSVKSKEKVTKVSGMQKKSDHDAESGSESDSEHLDKDIARGSVHLSAALTDTEDERSLGVEKQCLTLEVYKLDDAIKHFDSVPLDMEVKDLSKLMVGITSFASQMHLVIFDSEFPSVLSSKVIKITSASEVCQLRQVTRPEDVADTGKNPGATQSGPVLDYVYQVFEKFATSPPLSKQSRDLHLRMVFATCSTPSLRDKCMDYVNASLDRLKRDKGKDFSAVQIHLSVYDINRVSSHNELPWSIGGEGSWSASFLGLEIPIGEWIRKLVCLVPIQIARAEQNALKPMVDGLQLSGNADYADAISLANVIRFGLYEAVFDSWTGPLKVISSMGKQSSGKSYLLNHLSGSLLDVAGGRCTDGVWMTLRQVDGCLYVLLDFEGLGSFERSEQEDMLLSMLNAAISNLTIFNKKDFHLDKETEAIFERFQNGVSLVKTDAKLFKGLFYMAIKDVDISDVEDLKKEFFNKISQICSKSQDNFLTRMYGGSVEIAAMPSFNRPEFHEGIADIAGTVEELEESYQSGRSFLVDLKLIIAQITTKDWSPIDSKRVALRISLLRKHLESAISVGCFVSDGQPKPLIQFDDCVDISDEPLIVDDRDFPIGDTALELIALQDKKVTGEILLRLMGTFKSIFPRKGERDEEWHSSLETFLSALVQRRKRRVLEWIALNTLDFPNDGDIQKLQLEAVALLAEVQQNLLLCSCKCERCFLRCVQEKGHPSTHSCMGDHRCVAMCTYCLEEETAVGAGPCNDAAGHDGPHDCQTKSHTCGKCCIYAATSSNCNGNCSKKSGHSGDHQCNSRQHTCNQICSLPYCKNPCVSPIDVGDHQIHACHEKFCPIRCTMNSCNRTCATEDHFHGIRSGVKHHFCGSEHPCSEKCEYKGYCEVLTEVSKKTKTFSGQRATFDYVLVSEQNGHRKGCCIVIPPNEDRHQGPHSHSSNSDVVHFCETRCPSCGYFCNRPIEHGGLHNTTHGNMRDVNFVAESEEIDILDRKYAWGESGVAEMCQMHCKAQGRGHIHLIHCPANKDNGTCRKLFDGAQHEVRKYGPDFDMPKDEITHAAYWEYVRFEDPCSAEEKKQFALCNHQCKSDEHTPSSGAASSSAFQGISYCTESLWHQPIRKADLVKLGTGYITDDGHHFSCDHSTNLAVNVIFIIDKSGSMAAGDIRPSMTKFSNSHGNRLGCVFEAILRFIRTRLSSVKEDLASVVLFDSTASTVISLQDMKESLVDELLKNAAYGGTNYSTGLKHAEQILSLAATDARLSRKSPVIIFLSDGGNGQGNDPLFHISVMKALDPRLQVHTIMFGNDPNQKILEDMAKAGDGTFGVSLDEVQLSRRFEGLAKSLRPQVASLLRLTT